MCAEIDPYQLDLAFGQDRKKQLSAKFKSHVPTFPRGQVAVIADHEPQLIQDFYWSLVPKWSPEFAANYKYPTFNAKVEGLFDLKTWKPLIGKKHCVIISTAFYEWHYDDHINKKGSHLYHLKQTDSPVTLMAGLWDSWTDKATGEILHSCTMITNPANEMMAELHNSRKRMPAFLTTANYQHWIDPELPIHDRMELIKPIPEDFLQAEEIAKPQKN